MNQDSGDKRKLPITVIGGYLGTGKTSLVNHLLREADGLRLAILVNEFGSLSIDENLIIEDGRTGNASGNNSTPSNLISIAGGCVCCSYGSDLTLALLNMLELDPLPDHVVLEASGVAIPSAIAASVSLLPGYSMDGIVVLVNAETVREQASDKYIGDTITRQLENADLVILNKTDLVSHNQLEETSQWIDALQPAATVIPAQHGVVPPPVLLQSFIDHRNVIESNPPVTHESGLYITRTFRVERPVNAEALAKWLSTRAPGVLRAKGFVRTITAKGEPATSTVQVVGKRCTVTQASVDNSPDLVVIGISDGFDEQGIQNMLSECAIV